MRTYKVFSDSPKLTEYQFFKRELGLELTHVSSTSFDKASCYDGRKVLIASTRPELWIDTLNSLPKHSVVFFLLGNETYQPTTFNALNDIPSIQHVFIYNPPTRVKSIHHWYALYGDLIDQFPRFSIRVMRDILRDNHTSRHLKNKFIQTQIRYSWTALPQGYSNSFVSGLVATQVLSNAEDYSLIDSKFNSNFADMYTKQRRLIFVGQKTNRRRSQVVDFLSKRDNSFFVSKETGFGGTTFDGDLTYVEMLLSSWFNVIPPGHFNNSNHRYTESCIAGSIPVILFHNSIDHSDNNNWTKALNPARAHSFKRLIGYLENLSDANLTALANSIRNEDFSHIWQTRDLLHELLDK